MSDVDPTPDTPITIGDRLGWWRGDVAARFTTLEAKVEALSGTPAASFATIKTELDDLQAQITDLRGGGMSNTLSDLGVDIRAVRSGVTTELELIIGNQEAFATRLDRIQASLGAEPYNDLELASLRGMLNVVSNRLDNVQAALGAEPYNDLELASLRGMLNNVMLSQTAIIDRLGADMISTELPGVRGLLSLILTAINAGRTEAQAGTSLLSGNIATVNSSVLSGNSLISGLEVKLGDIDTSILSGNDILSGIDINIGSNNTLTADITAAINATSGSIRGEIVALKEQDATNHGNEMAQLITIAGQTGLTRAEIQRLTDSETGVTASIGALQTIMQTSISSQTTAINAATTAQTAAINALFDEHIGLSIGNNGEGPMSVTEWLDSLDEKLRYIAFEFGWGQS